jgi:hypothetical protein
MKVLEKTADYVWLTTLGEGLYENLNPYWGYCDGGGVVPRRVCILHPVRETFAKEKVAEGLDILSKEYFQGDAAKAEGIRFDLEDVATFVERARAVFRDAVHRSFRVIVDISPTTWGLVPAYLTRLALAHTKIVQSVICMQYLKTDYRARPYPLIPRGGILVHDLFSEFSRGG